MISACMDSGWFKSRLEAGCGGSHLLSQILRRWRQENGKFKASQVQNVNATLSQKQNTKNKRAGRGLSGRGLT
jgi:hypothetical protein